MKKIKSILTILVIVAVAITLLPSKLIFANSSVNSSNYNELRQQMEDEANEGIIIKETTSQEYMFGSTYAKTRVDGWNVNIQSTAVDANGVQTIRFTADEGYVLPAPVKSKESPRLAKSSIRNGVKSTYTVENNVGILTVVATDPVFDKISNYVAPAPVYVHLVAIPEGTKESEYLKDYAFVEIEHQGIDFNLTQFYTGISPVVQGSRTYLAKKNKPFKVYYMNQEHMKPIETIPSTTGVSSPELTDYANRYRIIDGVSSDYVRSVLAYDTTIFNVFVYNFSSSQWVRLDSYDFYHADNVVTMPAADNENITVEGKKVVGFGVQQVAYQYIMSNVYEWKKYNVTLDHTYETKAMDYNVQWTTTGVDGGSDHNRVSSLRHRFGDIYLVPIYKNVHTVRFIDHDGTILDNQSVDEGGNAIAPVDPTRDGYDFTGWDKEFTNITSSIDVYANYKEQDKEPPVTPEVPEIPETPETPETPVTPEVPDTPEPIAPVIPITPQDPQTPLIQPVVNEPANNVTAPEEVVKDAENKDTNKEVVKDNATPKAKGTQAAWALVNLLCTIVTALFAIIALFMKHRKEEDNDDDKEKAYEDTQDTSMFIRRRWTKIAGILIALVSITIFIFTEDVRLPMIMIDKYTILMFIILIIQLIVFIIARKWKNDDNTNNESIPSQATQAS